MRLIRIVGPALVGALLLLVAVQTTATGLGENGESAVQAFRSGLVPAAVGVALLLSSLAIARRSRAGYLLGISVAALMVLGGIAVIAVEIEYLGRGGMGAAFAGGFIVVYEFSDAGTASTAGNELAEYLGSGPGRVQFASDTRFVLRQLGTTLVFFPWSPGSSPDPRAPKIEEALRTLGFGFDVPGAA